MVPPKKPQTDIGNNGNKRDLSNMPYNKRDSAMGGKADGKGQNGARSGFRTDAAISNSRVNERTLQPWVPDSSDGIDGSLEKSSNSGAWDQFAENERLFGLKTDYDENIYTTTIDKSHPQYRERMAAADRKAREIERTLPTTAHVAEERVMDFVSGGGDDRGGDEEDKYSGVRRQDFPPLSSRENKYTPPAKRAPSSQSNVAGAPIDPAIISSQLRAPAKKQTTAKPEDAKLLSQLINKGNAAQATEAPQVVDPKPAAKPAPKEEPAKQSEAKTSETKTDSAKTGDVKALDKSVTPARPSAATSRTISPQVKEGAPSAASTVERDVFNSFKTFASQQRQNVEKIRSSKAKVDKEVKLTELKKFADSFKLSTPVPTDLISIIAKDPDKQKEIQAKALQNAEDVARTKTTTTTKGKDTPSKEGAAKPSTDTSTTQAAAADTRNAARPAPAQNTISPSNAPNRHPNARQSYVNPQYHNQPYRNDRSGQHLAQQNRQPLAQRLRNVEQQKMSQPPNHQPASGPDVRIPPTGPANNTEAFRRIGGVPNHMGGKLNPNSHEFRPNPFATSFNPNGHPSAGSSPRSAVNNVAEATSNPVSAGQLIRRKTKAVDVKKCYILAHVKTFTPPQGRNWDENDGLRPSYDTPPTWRQVQDNEKPDSTMLITSKEFLERQSFASSTNATPNHTHVVPSAHQHQLPFHLQQPAHGMGPRQSPHMPPVPIQNQQGHVPHTPYQNMDDHRMMHSNSAQSFASPRMAQVPITYTPAMSSAGQVPYNQPMMQPFVGPGTPQMGGFRNFSNNHQYMPQQPGGPMGAPMMPQFINPQGMVPGHQMPMYAGNHAQFMPPNGAHPQPIPGSNGYPSPGRPSAPMMVHQGSQQGQPVYGMSPNVQYQQPAFTPQQPGGQVGNVRGYNSPGPQHFGTSPSQMHSYGAQHRSGSNTYGAKPFNNHGQHQGPQQGTSVPASGPGRAPDGSEEAK
ncbi:hypothetical protein EsH8_II_001076 [Colletotrichum jinshuiense]